MIKSVITLIGLINQTMVPLLLQSVTYDVTVYGGVADVRLTQKYYNSLGSAVNTEFQFPVSDKAVFNSLEAVFRGKKVVGVIKEKGEAKKEFEDNKAKGNTVIYVDNNQINSDIMTAALGNLPKEESIEITLGFIMPLEVINYKHWELVIPSTLTPRYLPSGDSGTVWGNKAYNSETGNREYVVSSEYPWYVNVEVVWPSALGSVYSSSHQEELDFNNVDQNRIKTSFRKGTKQLPNKDFHLIIQDSNLFQDSMAVAKTKLPTVKGDIPRHAAMMQFIPPVFKEFMQDFQDRNPTMDEVVSYSTKYTRNEFIFIVDRSGSMSGSRIKMVRDAMNKLLTTLPTNSLFNIISFGSGYDPMFTASVPLSGSFKSEALNAVEKMEADFGGTEILEPFFYVGLLPRNSDYQRTVILLTDGDVSNTLDVINTVRKQQLETGAKYMSIGIGSGASMQLVRGVAEAGMGKSLMVEDTVDSAVFSLKMDALVKATITPFLKDFEVKFDSNYVESIAPLLSKNNLISPNEPFTMYALLRNGIESKPDQTTTVNVSFTDPISNRRITKVFTLSLENEMPDFSLFHKMAVYNILRADELNLKAFYVSSSLANQKDWLTTLSVNYQVLSNKYTAFICVVAENTVNPYESKNVIIPSVESNDYNPNRNRSANFFKALMTLLLFVLLIMI